MRQRSPRAGTFAPGFRTKLSRKRGSGGRATKSTTWCSPEPSPGDLFAPFGSLQKGLAACRRRNSPKSKGTTQNRREGQAPPLRGNGPHMSRNGRPHGAAPTKKPRAQCGANGGGKPPPYVATPYGSGAPSGRALHPLHRKAKRAAKGRPYGEHRVYTGYTPPPALRATFPPKEKVPVARQKCRALWAPHERDRG